MKQEEKIIILGHENPDVDSIFSGYLLQILLTKKGYLTEYIIPDKSIEEETLDFCLSNNINPNSFKKEIDFNNKKQKYILVDHHERELEGEIIAIIDHHPTFEEINCKNYHNIESSSTACIICKNNEEYFSKEELELAFLATMVDTCSFNSTKGKEEDKNWILDWCQKLNIDYDKLYQKGFFLTSLNDLKKASLHGLKKYKHNNQNIQSSYIQINNIENNQVNEIIFYIKEYINNNNIDLFIFIIYDMSKFNSIVYKITKTNIKSETYNKYTSRGSVVMPKIFNELRNKQIEDLNIFIGSSSSKNIDNKYYELAKNVSNYLANKKCNLIFGAASYGMMGICYNAFKDKERKISAHTTGKYYDNLQLLKKAKKYVHNDTFSRTKSIYDNADIILFLPGGSGTISEFFAMLEENRTTNKPKKIILFNYDNYFDKLLDLIKYSLKEQFNNQNIYNYFKVITEIEELYKEMAN